MQKIEIKIAKNISNAEKIIERICKNNGLILKLKTTLFQYTGSIHWHFKKDNEKGTLEITFLKKKNELWFSVHENRKANWIKYTLPKIKKSMEKYFS